MKKPKNRKITSQLKALSSNLDVLWLVTKNLICQSINALTLSLRGVKSSGVSPFSVWECFWLTVGSEQKKKNKTKQSIINKCTCFANLDQNELLITLIKQGMFFMFFLFPVYNIIPVKKNRLPDIVDEDWSCVACLHCWFIWWKVGLRKVWHARIPGQITEER